MNPFRLAPLLVAFTALYLAAPTQPARSEPRTVRLLTIGNSFANNALTYLPQIAEAAGHELIVARANLGGCTLERHWNHVARHEENPEGREGSPYDSGKHSLEDLLLQDDWDFITLQQVSFKSHDLATYYPFARDLHAYIRRYRPEAKILAHQIWAYRVDDPRFVPENEGKEPHTQKEMYEQVRDAYRRLASDLDIGIVPSGDAMFLADRDGEWGYRPDPEFDPETVTYPNLPRQDHSLHVGWRWITKEGGDRSLKMDGHHASAAGNYLLGCVWYETFFGESVVDNAFVPDSVDPDHAAFLRRTAHRVVTEGAVSPRPVRQGHP